MNCKVVVSTRSFCLGQAVCLNLVWPCKLTDLSGERSVSWYRTKVWKKQAAVWRWGQVGGGRTAQELTHFFAERNTGLPAFLTGHPLNSCFSPPPFVLVFYRWSRQGSDIVTAYLRLLKVTLYKRAFVFCGELSQSGSWAWERGGAKEVS